MADLDRAKQALKAAAEQGDDEAATKLAKFIREKQQEPSSDLSFLNRGIANTLGAPVDLVNAGLGAVGVPVSDEPLGGSESIESGFNALSGALGQGRITPREGERAQTTGAAVARGVGEAGSALLPLGLGAQALSRGGGAVGRGAERLVQGAAANPASTIGLELAAGAGSGAGEQAGAALTDDSQLGRLGGAIAGGVAAPAGALGAARFSSPALVARGVRKAAAPFTESGARVRAEEAVQGATSDPEQALQNLQQPREGNLSPAQRTEEEGLISLEARVSDKTPQDALARSEEISRSREDLVQRLRPDGDTQTTRAEVQGRVDNILQRSQEMTDEVQGFLTQRLQSLEPTQAGSQAGIAARESLEQARQVARARENELFQQVPDAKVSTSGLKKKFTEITKDVPKAQKDSIPLVANRAVRDFGTSENITELQGLRSRLLEESRTARAAGQNNTARISDQLADAVLDEMGARANNTRGVAGQALRDALDFSRSVNETFKRGAVGRVLSPDRVGGDRIPPERTLEAIIGAGGVRGDVGLQEALRAAPDSLDAAQDFILARLNRTAVKDGVLNPQQAERFLKDNADIMERIPQVRDNVADAIKLQRDVNRLTGRQQQLEKSLSSPQKSTAARLLNSRVDDEIAAVMRDRNPQQAAKQLRNIVRDNEDAVDGLEAGAMDFLIERSKSGKLDAFGNEVVSGNKMLKTLMSTKQRKVLREIVGDDGLNRAEKIARELSILEKADSVSALGKIIDDTPNALVDAVGTTAGARFGAQLGAGISGASLKTASLMSGSARDILTKLTGSRAEALITRAMHDEELFEALLKTSTKTQKGRREAANKLEAWLLGTGTRLLEEDEQ